MLREFISRAPPPIRDAAYGCARLVRSRVFNLPDPYDDMARIGQVAAPSAILDVGAHVGETAVAMAKVFPNHVIHAFEPIPENFAALRARVRHMPSVIPHEIALGERSGDASMFQNRNAQTSSLLDNGADNTTCFPEDTAHAAVLDVAMMRLDDWMRDHPDYQRLFIKADVQGAENLLIEGGSTTFSERVSVLYTEVSLGDLYENQADLFSVHETLLRDTPLRLYQLYRTRSSPAGRALWLDAMWVHQDVLTAMSALS